MAVASVGLALAGILGGRLEAQASPLRPQADDNTFPCLGRRLPLQVDGSPFLAASAAFNTTLVDFGLAPSHFLARALSNERPADWKLAMIIQ